MEDAPSKKWPRYSDESIREWEKRVRINVLNEAFEKIEDPNAKTAIQSLMCLLNFDK